jgi:hypothetical protein
MTVNSPIALPQISTDLDSIELIKTPERSSSAVSKIQASVKNGVVIATFKNGNSYLYRGVSRRAIAALKLMPTVSLGFWINEYCVHAEGVTFTRLVW